ncbi:unnamed protein product, partial [Laminaria digitata]
ARRSPRLPPSSSRPATAAPVRGAPLYEETGWTATMAEPLLDMCFDIFFKYGTTTLPLLPEVLALHQRCICQESEVLARIALRSLGRFVTSMHKSFPAASATIIRRQAAPGEEGGVTDLTKEGKDEEYTVWDCLTSSLCAIMHDNLPLELLNKPFHLAPESPVLAGSTTPSPPGGAPSSPAWAEREPSDEEQSSPAAGPAPSKPDSESSWGELQAAGGEEEGGEGGNSNAEASEGGANPSAGDGERRDSKQEKDHPAQQQQQQQELQEADGVSEGDNN